MGVLEGTCCSEWLQGQDGGGNPSQKIRPGGIKSPTAGGSGAGWACILMEEKKEAMWVCRKSFLLNLVDFGAKAVLSCGPRVHPRTERHSKGPAWSLRRHRWWQECMRNLHLEVVGAQGDGQHQLGCLRGLWEIHRENCLELEFLWVQEGAWSWSDSIIRVHDMLNEWWKFLLSCILQIPTQLSPILEDVLADPPSLNWPPLPVCLALMPCPIPRRLNLCTVHCDCCHCNSEVPSATAVPFCFTEPWFILSLVYGSEIAVDCVCLVELRWRCLSLSCRGGWERGYLMFSISIEEDGLCLKNWGVLQTQEGSSEVEWRSHRAAFYSRSSIWWVSTTETWSFLLDPQSFFFFFFSCPDWEPNDPTPYLAFSTILPF